MKYVTVFILSLILFLSAQISPAEEYYSKAERDQKIAHELDCVESYSQQKRPALWNKTCQVADEEIAQPTSVQERMEAHMARIEADLADLRNEQTSERESSIAAMVNPEKNVNTDKSGTDLWGRLLGRDNPLTKIDFGLAFFGYDYREPGLMRQDGYFSGIFAQYTYRTNENVKFNWENAFSKDSKINMFRIDARFSYGDVDYESDVSGYDNGIPNYIFETRAVAGYDMPLNEYFRLTPYVGLGYRFLLSDGGGRRSSVGHYNYDRESNYFYMPLGVEMHRDWRNSWSTDFILEYDLFLRGKQVSRLELGYDSVKNNQQVGLGLRTSVKVLKSTEKVDYFFEPFVRYWHIDDSDVTLGCYDGTSCTTGWVEPDNEQYEYGLKAGLSY